MIKIIFLLILCVIFYFLFKTNEHYQNLDEFYKLNELIDSGDESRKFSFTIEKINVEPVTNEFIDTSTIINDLETGQQTNNQISEQQTNTASVQGIVANNISNSTNDDITSVLNDGVTTVVSNYSGMYIIKFQENILVLKLDENIINESQGFMLSLTNPGEYIFECNNDFMVKKKMVISIESDNIIVDGNGIVINLSNNVNKTGVFKNGTANSNGNNNVIIKNMHFIYKRDNYSQFYSSQNTMQYNPQAQSSASSGGGGGVCTDYYGRNARNNVISDCYVYRTEFENNSGGIIGKYAAQKNGELIIMNCVVSGSDFEYNNYNTEMVRNIGGICGSYLGENGGKVLVYNCSNYASFSYKGSSGIIGGNAANNNSNVLLFCCSNFGFMTMKDMSSGLVGPNSCKDNSNLSIICCFSIEPTYITYNDTYGSFLGYSSVLNNSNLNIVLCYNTLNIDYQDPNTKYFVGPADSLNQSVSGSDGNSGSHTPEQQSQHERDSDSRIMLDYCFNSNIDMNLTDSDGFWNDIKNREFGSNSSNVTVTNSGRINLTNQVNNSNTLFSNQLSNYNLNLNGINNNEFPYNTIFSSHADKLMNISNNNIQYLFTPTTRNTVNLKQYFDNNIQNDRCIYTSNSAEYVFYYKLKYNLVHTSCGNESTTTDPNDMQYNSIFSSNVDYNLCKNKSMQNCDADRCVFKTFYESIRCYPKNNNNNNTNVNSPVGSGQQFINCFNLNPTECQNSQNCYIGPGNVCVNRV